ncbi:MAG: protease pro-enzyme activation domain-containing protein [Syntrophobacteraceae bacterium]
MVLHGNVHPKARPEFDVGPTDPSLPMNRTILLLKIATEKQAKLDRLVAEQQDPSSPNFHHWLTPEEFGKRFGRSPEEIATVKGWLISHGFTIDETAKSGTWINFSGAAADVNRAFHTEMHDYQVNGQLRHANSTDPSIPRALAGLVAGPVSLHNFPRKAMHTPRRHIPDAEKPQAKRQPGYTEPDNGGYDLAPGDFAVIYDVNAVYNMGYNGAGVTIAVVERTIPAQGDSQEAAIKAAITKWNTFRSTFGLPDNPPVITVNGPSPGDTGVDDDAEADLDVEWAGAVAPGATINCVTSKTTYSADGVDLSAQYIVDNNLAPIMSDCFGTCESQNTTPPMDNAFYNSLWEQAASQGITVFVVTGDSGAYACTDDNGNPISPKAVNGLASTPYNIAVGGTALSSAPQYWNNDPSTENIPDGVSALGYMPEVAWNEWNAAPYYDWTEWASGGGPSSLYPKPAWQVCPGVPSDGARDMPDVSLNSDVYVGYRVYTCYNYSGPCTATDGNPANAFFVFGGTSAASPSFAGIMALIVQSEGGERQGNINTTLYQLANAQYSGVSGASPVFHDITSGTNGFVGDGVDLPGYSCSTTPGYNLVTGLGSVDAFNLLQAFPAGGSLTVTINPAGAVSAGAQWNVDDGAWQSSGSTVGVAFGSHTVSFKAVTGWNTPESQTVNIASGLNTSAGGLYVQQTGSLTVSIVPAAAAGDSATWNVDGQGPNASGTTVSGLGVGTHTVSFNGIAGWNTPGSQTVSISYNKTTSASGTYVLLPPTVSFSIDNGAQSAPTRTVTLDITATGIAADYIASESPTFAGATWKPYSTAPSFTLSAANGTKTVYLKVKNAAGLSARASASIILAQLPVVTSFRIDAGAASTINSTVTLNNKATESPTYYMVSESPTFADNPPWRSYSTAPKFALTNGSGTNTVYFQVENTYGVSAVESATIQLIVPPVLQTFQIDNVVDGSTSSRTVTLNNTTTGGTPTYYMASQSKTFAGAAWKPYSTAPSFTLSAAGGPKTVYLKVKNAAKVSNLLTATITLE